MSTVYTVFKTRGSHKEVTRKWVTFNIKNGTGFIGWSRWGYIKLFMTDQYLRYYVFNTKHRLLYWLCLTEQGVKAKSLMIERESTKIGLPQDPNPLHYVKPLMVEWLRQKMPFLAKFDLSLQELVNSFVYPFLTKQECGHEFHLVKKLTRVSNRTQAAKLVYKEAGKLGCSMVWLAVKYPKATRYAVDILGLKPQDLSVNEWEYVTRCLLGRTNKSVKMLYSIDFLIGFNKPIKFKEFESETSLRMFIRILTKLLKEGDSAIPVSSSWKRLKEAIVPKYTSTLIEWGQVHGICIGQYGPDISSGKRSCAAIKHQNKLYFIDVVNNGGGGLLLEVRTTYNEDAPNSLKEYVCNKLCVKGKSGYTPEVLKPFAFPKSKFKRIPLTANAFKALVDRAYYILKHSM